MGIRITVFYIIWEHVFVCTDRMDSVFLRSSCEIEPSSGSRYSFFQPSFDSLNFDTKPMTTLLIMILLYMCGDTAALVDPGPMYQSIDYTHLEKLWEEEKNNCKINKKKDIELYKEFDSWLKNKICTEREREKMKEIFIEKEIDWRNEIKCVTRNTRTYTRIKNCRKNNILENWKKIEKEKNKKS